MSLSLLAEIKAATQANPIRREMPFEVKVLDEKKGIIRFVASDESMDHSNEIVRQAGWRFNFFKHNAPFPDSHDYSTITKILGQVIAWEVVGAQLIEDVQFALTSKDDTLADWAFKMYRDKFLRACSVGFVPSRYATKWDSDRNPLLQQIGELKLDAAGAARVQCVYIEQEQIELSACILGCNPNALAKAYKAGTLTEGDLDKLCALKANLETRTPADSSAPAGVASARTKLALLAAIQNQLSKS